MLVELLQQYSLVTAFLLDILIGDPRRFPHPVKLIGFCARRLENYLRIIFPRRLKIAGVILNLLIVIPTFAVTYILIQATSALSPLLGTLAEIALIFTTLSVKSLIIAGRDVMRPLKNGQTAQAQLALQEIVSRDASDLDQNQIMKGVLETTAENSSDGVIAPLFFAALGGAPLAMAYKAVNTLDSLVGYRNEKYKDFGWFSARLDDIANFIPARITGFLIFLASIIMLQHPLRCARAIWCDSQKGPSPNAGVPICGLAGALDIQLGGPSRLKDGSLNNIPYVGGNRRELVISDFYRVVALVILLPILFLISYYLMNNIAN